MSAWWTILACHDDPVTDEGGGWPLELPAPAAFSEPEIDAAALMTHLESGLPDCPTSDEPTLLGVVSDPSLDQLSGIAASQRSGGAARFWVHEDRGAAELVAVDAAGTVRSRHLVVGVDVVDAEDIATALHPDTEVPWLFLADIGDNEGVRDRIRVIMLEEPDPDEDSEVEPQFVELRYPGGPRDAETLLVDPRTLDLFIVTKQPGNTRVFRKAAPHDDPGPHELEQVATLSLQGERATGGDIAPDGSAIIVRTYLSTAWLWRRADEASVAGALLTPPCPIELASEPQGEAVTFAPGSVLVTVSEGQTPPLFHVSLQGW